MKITGEQLIQAVRDANLSQDCESKSLIEAYEKFIGGAFLESIAEYLDRPVNAANITEVKCRYVEEWAKFSATLEGGRSEEGRQLFVENGEAMGCEFREMLTGLMSLAQDRADALNADLMGLMEMSPENRAKYGSGELTVGDLLLTQPEILLEGAM